MLSSSLLYQSFGQIPIRFWPKIAKQQNFLSFSNYTSLFRNIPPNLYYYGQHTYLHYSTKKAKLRLKHNITLVYQNIRCWHTSMQTGRGGIAAWLHNHVAATPGSKLGDCHEPTCVETADNHFSL